MKPFNIFRSLLCLSLFLSVLSSCGNKNKQTFEIGDGGLLSEKPCSAPCFHGIIPGITSEKKAIETITDTLNISDCDKWDKNNYIDKGIRCSKFSITFNNLSVVNAVSFEPSQTISVIEIINKYGTPDGVGISILGIEMQPPIAMQLYFDKENMIVYLPEQNNDAYNLEKVTSVNDVGYFDQSAYKISKKLAQDWKGFGEYSYGDTNVP